MSSSLEINGKQLSEIKVAAAVTGYSRDYITRLAREGKILASQIGRQWFVDTDSLRHYSEMSDLEQKIRQRRLSDERKQERLVRELVEQRADEKKKLKRAMSMRARAVAALVLVLGLSTGYALERVPLVSSSLSRQVASAPIVQQFGAATAKSQAVPVIAADSINNDNQGEVLNFTHESVRLATLDEVGQGVLLLSQASSSQPTNPAELFSDEVKLVTDSSGQQYAVRVNAQGEEVEKIPFVVVPVTSNNTP